MTKSMTSAKWWVAEKEEHHGPFSLDEIIRRIEDGEIKPEQLACPVGGHAWKSITEWGEAFSTREMANEDLPPPPPIPKSMPANESSTNESEAGTENSVETTSVNQQNQAIDNASKPTKSESPRKNDEQWKAGLALIGIFGIAGLITIYFVAFLWVLLSVGVVTAVACTFSTLSRKRRSERWTPCVGAVIAAAASVGIWYWIKAYDFDVPRLPSNATTSQIVQAYQDRVASIHTVGGYRKPRNDGSTSTIAEHHTLSGTGLLLANDRTKGLIVTSRDSIDLERATIKEGVTSMRITVRFPSLSASFPAKLVAIHETLDLALLVVQKPFDSPGAVPIGTYHTIKKGDKVVALGNPTGSQILPFEGVISSIAPDEVATTCPINPGTNGGPIVSKKGGFVVAFNSQAKSEVHFSGQAVVAARIFHQIQLTKEPNKDTGLPHHIVVKRFADGRNVFSGESRNIPVDPSTSGGRWKWLGNSGEAKKLLKLIPIRHPD